jgi:small subunit ribosomal protein S20
MPQSKSAEKRLRQSENRRTRNRVLRSELRTRYRKVLSALEGAEKAQTPEFFRTATKRIDQAAAKGVIHKNAASRMKSRLAARMRKAGVKQPAAAAPSA